MADTDAPGFWVKPLIEDDHQGIRTWLMKVYPGAFSDMHGHNEYEQIYVLEGAFYDQDHEYGPGRFYRARSGSLAHGGQ